jgi:hypothetical protein
MIVVLCPPPYQTKSSMVLYLENEQGYQMVQSWYSNAVNIEYHLASQFRLEIKLAPEIAANYY